MVLFGLRTPGPATTQALTANPVRSRFLHPPQPTIKIVINKPPIVLDTLIIVIYSLYMKKTAAATWIKTPNGNYQTRTEKDGKVYLSQPVPYAFAVKLGMKA
jgi:hypothetical protein